MHWMTRRTMFAWPYAAVLADEERARAYDAAITRQVARRKDHFMANGECHVLDIVGRGIYCSSRHRMPFNSKPRVHNACR